VAAALAAANIDVVSDAASAAGFWLQRPVTA
jgi:hypothetical protein